MSVSMCVCVCLSTIRSTEPYVRSSPKFVRMLCIAVADRSSSGGVVIMLCTSGFVHDVIFAHKPINVAQRRHPAEAQCTRSLGLGYKLCAVIPAARQRTDGTT